MGWKGVGWRAELYAHSQALGLAGENCGDWGVCVGVCERDGGRKDAVWPLLSS